MRYLTKNSRRFFSLGLCALLPCLLFAQTSQADDQDTPSFFFNVGGGYAVYKSEMVQSNDTSTSVNYGFGVYGGSDKSVGMMLQREQGTYTFALNGSSIITANQDIHLRYRYGPVYLGLIVNSSQLEVTAPPDADSDGFLDQNTDGEEYMKVSNTGMGINVGTNIAVTRAASVYVDINSVTTSLVQQSYIENTETEANGFTEAEIAIGPRLDVDFGGSIALTKNWLDMNFGFKQRTMSVTVDSAAFNEQISSTYLGFRAGWSF
jgi:hypothetical protein